MSDSTKTYAYLPYNRAQAVRYARTWAYKRNPLFADFIGIGGDCTNFVSQCLLAGAPVMNFTPDFGWFYRSVNDRAPAFSGVDAFYRYLTGNPVFLRENGGVGPYGEETAVSAAELGDVIQLQNEDGVWYHTLILTGFDGDDPLVSAHTNDALDRPLSTYPYANSRGIHLLGVRIACETDELFLPYLGGLAFREVLLQKSAPILPSNSPSDT